MNVVTGINCKTSFQFLSETKKTSFSEYLFIFFLFVPIRGTIISSAQLDEFKKIHPASKEVKFNNFGSYPKFPNVQKTPFIFG